MCAKQIQVNLYIRYFAILSYLQLASYIMKYNFLYNFEYHNKIYLKIQEVHHQSLQNKYSKFECKLFLWWKYETFILLYLFFRVTSIVCELSLLNHLKYSKITIIKM